MSDKEGFLKQLPSGRWTIMRFGREPVEITSGELFRVEVDGRGRQRRAQGACRPLPAGLRVKARGSGGRGRQVQRPFLAALACTRRRRRPASPSRRFAEDGPGPAKIARELGMAQFRLQVAGGGERLKGLGARFAWDLSVAAEGSARKAVPGAARRVYWRPFFPDQPSSSVRKWNTK